MSEPRRWMLSYQSVGDYNAWIVSGPDVDDEVEVMPLAEHEAAALVIKAARNILELWNEGEIQSEPSTDRVADFRWLRGALENYDERKQ